ncbi:cyclin-dependent kinase 2-interacting protein-like [Hemibagrus wyckioides]|uniref:cyclin-dependent kinase 2-interacting protein-like n=1 Tax=Hemibagrus wyckioides TaxID=337641 RepID=UPI00266B53E6|nr:cyclin-dependent kinase 2-interacting protein-like [Hemibagrus wyckioides]
MDDATTPGRKGNLTGSARKVKDNAADWHNLILKWERLSDEGSSIATKIVNFRLSKDSPAICNYNTITAVTMRSVKDPEVMVEGLISSAAPADEQTYHSNPELEEECTKLQNIVDKMKGICELETFQYGENGRPTPLFHTWSTKQFGNLLINFIKKILTF